jgi:hypothetical protein
VTTKLWSEARGVAARNASIMESGSASSTRPNPTVMSETAHDAYIYGRYGTVSIAGNPSDLDLLNVTFTGDGGDTYYSVSGGATSGALGTGGYHGTFTNSYGGDVHFTNIERFNVATGLHADNVTPYRAAWEST